jgi:transcription initiation factor TFIIB
MTYPSITDSERGEIVCGGCGLVLLQNMESFNAESSSHTQEEFLNQSRTGPATSLRMHDGGLSTIIGRDIDSGGKSLTNSTKSTFSRLRTWDSRSKSKAINRNFSKAFTILDGLKSKLAIPENVLERTAYIYRKATAKKLARGRSIIPLLCAALYVTCRETDTPRTLDDIAKAGNVSRKVLSRTVRVLIKELDLRLDQYNINAFISRISNNLGIKEKVQRDAYEILRKTEESRIAEGKNPVAQAASSLYLACILNGVNTSQRVFAEVSGVSSVTIRNRISIIRKTLNLDY